MQGWVDARLTSEMGIVHFVVDISSGTKVCNMRVASQHTCIMLQDLSERNDDDDGDVDDYDDVDDVDDHNNW